MEPEFRTKPCKSCDRPISYNPEWKHIPNYCQECRARFKPVEMITRTCRGCGHQFTFPSNVRYWPHYCRECQAKRENPGSGEIILSGEVKWINISRHTA